MFKRLSTLLLLATSLGPSYAQAHPNALDTIGKSTIRSDSHSFQILHVHRPQSEVFYMGRFSLTESNCNESSSESEKQSLLPFEDVQSQCPIIIFDWDDTLLSGEVNGIDTQTEEVEKLETSALQLLEAAADIGKVYIVSNGSERWLKFSMETYFPRFASLLPRLKVISARSLFKNKYPHRHTKWKSLVFKDILKIHGNGKVNPIRIISIGDSNIERNALQRVTQRKPRIISKTIKLIKNPSIIDLTKELELLKSNLETWAKSDDLLDFDFLITPTHE